MALRLNQGTKPHHSTWNGLQQIFSHQIIKNSSSIRCHQPNLSHSVNASDMKHHLAQNGTCPDLDLSSHQNSVHRFTETFFLWEEIQTCPSPTRCSLHYITTPSGHFAILCMNLKWNLLNSGGCQASVVATDGLTNNEISDKADDS